MQPKGLKNVRYSGKNTKSARDNWSDEVYKIIDVKTLYNRARTFKVKAIDPKITKGTISRLDRTEILKIPPDTKIDGITIQEWEKRYNAPIEPESGAESESEDEVETGMYSEVFEKQDKFEGELMTEWELKTNQQSEQPQKWFVPESKNE